MPQLALIMKVYQSKPTKRKPEGKVSFHSRVGSFMEKIHKHCWPSRKGYIASS